MKLFLKILIGLLLFEFLLVFSSNILFQKTTFETLSSILSFFVQIFSYPLFLLDKSYPFYANGSVLFSIFIFIANLIVQTFFLYFLIKVLRKNKVS